MVLERTNYKRRREGSSEASWGCWAICTCQLLRVSSYSSIECGQWKRWVQERDDLRKRTRQERLYAMRFNSFKSQLERERHVIAIQ